MKHPKLAQHFLIDKNIAKKIVNSAELTSQDTVVEIGPGRGELTELIVPYVKKLICIEIDRELVEYLKTRFKNYKNIKIIHTDFLKWSFPDSLNSSRLPLKFISNLPYYITSPILKKVLSFKNWSIAIFMLQKDVGERIISKIGTKSCGVLTLLVQFYSIPEKLFIVNKNCFKPKPEVDSMVIKFIKKKLSAQQYSISKKLFNLIKFAFAHRRKTILNSLSSGLTIPKELLAQKLAKANIDPSSRAEDISLEDFIKLTLDLKDLI